MRTYNSTPLWDMSHKMHTTKIRQRNLSSIISAQIWMLRSISTSVPASTSWDVRKYVTILHNRQVQSLECSCAVDQQILKYGRMVCQVLISKTVRTPLS